MLHPLPPERDPEAQEEKPLSVFESANVVSLQAGDVVLFRCERRLSDLERDRAVEILNEVFPANESMILDGGQDIAVLRPEPGFMKRLLRRKRYG